MDPNELAGRVERALLDDPTTRDYAIGVVVEENTVRLLGEVPSSAVKELAGIVAAAVPGVRRVSNEVEIWPREGYG
ncbi:MAG: BON domain-containing protein [Chloroflexi bacterium]|nr:BON domain-containing protein [Chloroflexota bacterium]